MIVFSIPQPWASLMVTRHPDRSDFIGIKACEIRKSKPAPIVLAEMENRGILIHASTRKTQGQRQILKTWPFNQYCQQLDDMPFGAIIGSVQVATIVKASTWLDKSILSNFGDGPHLRRPDGATWDDEQYELMDFNPSFYICELLRPTRIEEPIYCKKGVNHKMWHYPDDRLPGHLLTISSFYRYENDETK